jgi:hypothetical protein
MINININFHTILIEYSRKTMAFIGFLIIKSIKIIKKTL